jgi:hypothetical protein
MKSVSMPRIFLVKDLAEKSNGHSTPSAPVAAPAPSGLNLIQTIWSSIFSAISCVLKMLTARVGSVTGSGGTNKDKNEGDNESKSEPFVLLPLLAKKVGEEFTRTRATFLAEASLPNREMDRLCVQSTLLSNT